MTKQFIRIKDDELKKACENFSHAMKRATVFNNRYNLTELSRDQDKLSLKDRLKLKGYAM